MEQQARSAEASERYQVYLEGLVEARTLELKHAIQRLMLEVESHRSAVAALRESGEALEAEVRAKTEELISAHRQLTDAKRLSDIGNLAATVAHELRNPLSVMQTAIYNLRRKHREPALDKHLENMERKIRESAQIINNLASYARVGAPSVQKTGLVKAIDRGLAATAAEFGRGRAHIERDLRAIEGLELDADPEQLSQAFENVLSNAYQATPDGGTIKVSAIRDPAGQRVRISISDKGPGIPPDLIEKVFDPFFTTRTHGTGLGLAISKDIVAHHGGDISIHSREGAGTTVTVTLPVR